MRIRHYGPNPCPAGIADTDCMSCGTIHVIRWLDTTIAPHQKPEFVTAYWDCPTTGMHLSWRFTQDVVENARLRGAVVYAQYEWSGADQRMYALECAARKGEAA